MSEAYEIDGVKQKKKPEWIVRMICALWEVIKYELDAYFSRI